MFPIPPTMYKYIAAAVGALVVVLAVWLHVAGDRRTEKKLAETETALIQEQQARKALEEQFVAATRDRDLFKAQVSEADAAREQVRKDFEVKMSTLKKTPAPAECKAAVQWVKKNKELLK